MKKILIINNEKDADDFGWIPTIKEAILKIEKCEFEVLHHKEINEKTLEKIKPDYIYLTGRVTYDWDLEEILSDYKNEIEMIKTTDTPILGVCAGHQLIAIAYGANFGKMIEVEPGEEDIRETGFTEIEITKHDKIFHGLDEKFRAFELHRDEVKSVPEEFYLLASTEMCKIQAMKHKNRDLYSVQFHPEKYNEENTDGKIILENFLKL
ncbi:glutamine amidotransferase-related protein [Peptoniphilus sp.]|jgi:GMP synthase (glutamine-hydrolysing)|uniref:glutamine amidotransferase-related protein n=1 Tax=Peptoniphilus sp. TaxID=1971214 RepID=UPI003D8A8E89